MTSLVGTEGLLTVMYHEQTNLAIMLLVNSQKLSKPLSLSDLMAYSLTPVSSIIGTPYVYLFKMNKASMPHSIAENTQKDLSIHQVFCLFKMEMP